MVLCIIIFYSFLLPSREDRARNLRSEYNATNFILQVGCLSYNLTLKNLVLLHKPSTQVFNAFNWHDTTGKTMKYIYIYILFQDSVTNFSQKVALLQDFMIIRWFQGYLQDLWLIEKIWRSKSFLSFWGAK